MILDGFCQVEGFFFSAVSFSLCILKHAYKLLMLSLWLHWCLCQVPKCGIWLSQLPLLLFDRLGWSDPIFKECGTFPAVCDRKMRKNQTSNIYAKKRFIEITIYKQVKTVLVFTSRLDKSYAHLLFYSYQLSYSYQARLITQSLPLHRQSPGENEAWIMVAWLVLYFF